MNVAVIEFLLKKSKRKGLETNGFLKLVVSMLMEVLGF